MELIELCAGSAAITRKLCGLPKLLGFMGSKDRYADQIIEAWGLPAITSFALNDPGFWGVIWEAYCKERFSEVADRIDCWSNLDARSLFDYCRKNRDSGDLSFRAACRLCLLASTYGGGEIGGFKGKHKRRPSVDGFIPSRESLTDRIRKFSQSSNISSTSMCITKVAPLVGRFVYIDPPYSGLSGYENNADRQQVIATARKWKSLGCSVAISESVALDVELGKDWESRQLKTLTGQCRKNAKCSDEFLTYCKMETRKPR